MILWKYEYKGEYTLSKNTSYIIIGIMVLAIIGLLTFAIVTVINDQNNSKSKQNTEQAVKLEDNKKVEINDQILNSYIIQYLISQKFGIDISVKDLNEGDIDTYTEPKNKSCDTDQFSAQEMLNTAAFILLKDEKNDEQKNNEVKNYTLEVEKIQNKAKQIFGKEVNLAEITNKVQNSKLDVNLNLNFTAVPYKIREVKYDKNKKVYTLILDYVKYTEENYSANKISYDDTDIIDTYILKVKKVKSSSNKETYNYISLGCE